jgi:ABC-type nitrate/sulfonate/bicarbonate transport system ATPase subunit
MPAVIIADEPTAGLDRVSAESMVRSLVDLARSRQTVVLVITHELADNLMLASRNLANVLVIEPRYADPLALVHYKKVLVTKGAMEQLKEMLS